MTREELMKKAAECDLGRVVGPLETLLDEEWESLHRFVDYCLRAEVEALRKDAAAKVAEERERLIREVAALHMAQSVNNQNHPRAWHDGVDAALDAIRGTED